jgi:hypothetical protein
MLFFLVSCFPVSLSFEHFCSFVFLFRSLLNSSGRPKGLELRGHVSLDCKSPEPQGFGAEGTLGILFVPTARVFPGKV